MRRNAKRIVIGVVAGALFIAAATPLLLRPVRARVRLAADARRLGAVGMVLQLYANDHRGAYPHTLVSGLQDEVTDPGFACCAASDQSTPDARFPYVYLGGLLATDTLGTDTVVAYSPLAYSGGEGSNVLFGDGHVSWTAAADLPAVLARGGPVTRPTVRLTTVPAGVQSGHG